MAFENSPYWKLDKSQFSFYVVYSFIRGRKHRIFLSKQPWKNVRRLDVGTVRNMTQVRNLAQEIFPFPPSHSPLRRAVFMSSSWEEYINFPRNSQIMWVVVFVNSTGGCEWSALLLNAHRGTSDIANLKRNNMSKNNYIINVLFICLHEITSRSIAVNVEKRNERRHQCNVWGSLRSIIITRGALLEPLILRALLQMSRMNRILCIATGR